MGVIVLFLSMIRFLKLSAMRHVLPIHSVSPDDSDFSLLKPGEGDIWKSFQSKIPTLSGKHLRPMGYDFHSLPGVLFSASL